MAVGSPMTFQRATFFAVWSIYRRPYSFVAEIPEPSNSSFQSSMNARRAPCATTWSQSAW